MLKQLGNSDDSSESILGSQVCVSTRTKSEAMASQYWGRELGNGES